MVRDAATPHGDVHGVSAAAPADLHDAQKQATHAEDTK